MNFLEENVGKTLQDVVGGEFLDEAPKAQTKKGKMDKADDSKLGSFCTTEANNTIKRYFIERENICKYYMTKD